MSHVDTSWPPAGATGQKPNLELREEGPERRTGVGRGLVVGVVLAPGHGVTRHAALVAHTGAGLVVRRQPVAPAG